MVTGEANASVDVFWRSKDGYEMHLQLGGTSSETILDEAQEAITKITKAGGTPRPHRNGASDAAPTTGETPNCSVCSKKMKYREGEGRNGKPYKGFFCPDRDCEGKPVWVDD
jgi:hypothetical protein